MAAANAAYRDELEHPENYSLPGRCPVCAGWVHADLLYRFGSISHVPCARVMDPAAVAAIVAQQSR